MPTTVDTTQEEFNRYLATLNPGTRALIDQLNRPVQPVAPRPAPPISIEATLAASPGMVFDLTVGGLLSIVDAVVRREFPAPDTMDAAETAAYNATTKYYGVIRVGNLAKTSIIAFRTRVWEIYSNGEWANVVEFTYDPAGNIVSQGQMFHEFDEWYADVCEQADLSNTYKSALWTNLTLVLPFADNPQDVLNLTERNFELLAVQANALKADLIDNSPEARVLLNRKIQQASTMTSDNLRELWGRTVAPTYTRSNAFTLVLPNGKTFFAIVADTEALAATVETRIAPIVAMQHVTDMGPIEGALRGEPDDSIPTA